MRELTLLVEKKRTVMDVFAMWLPKIGVALLFLFIGSTKFRNNPSGMWFKLFEQIGLGQWFRYFTGATQVIGASLLLTPRTLTLGAAMLACTMIGAMVVDIFVVHAVGYVFLPLALLGLIVTAWFAGRFGAHARG